MNSTLQARETLSLLTRIGMDGTSKLEAYHEHVKKREQAERRILNALLRRNQPGLTGR
jgi:hypothetical protein